MPGGLSGQRRVTIMSLKDEKLGIELSAYLDGELGERDAERIEEALRGSAELRAELESMRSMRQALRSLPRAAAPAGMAERVLLRAERATLLDGRPVDAAGRTGGGWVGRIAAAAVILIAVGVGLTVLSRMGETKDPGDRVAVNNDDRVIHAPGAPKIAEPAAMPSKIGKGRGALADASADVLNPPVVQFTLNTDNLDLVQHDVQRVLDRNGLQDVAMVNDAPKTEPRRTRIAARGGNYYDQVAANPNRVEIDIVVDEGQLQKVIADLSEIRSNQRVAQIPERDAKDVAVADPADTTIRARMAKGAGGAAEGKMAPAPSPVSPSIGKSGPVETSTHMQVAAVTDTVNGTTTVAGTQQAVIATGTAMTQPTAPAGADAEVLTMDGMRGVVGGGTVYAKIRQLRIVLNAVETDLDTDRLRTQPATTRAAEAAK